MASRDSLTGLWNRKTFDKEFEGFVDEAQAVGLPLALVIVSIDSYKEANDTLGHQAGDEMLKLVARHLQAFAKGRGRVYRTGGDEMTVVLMKHDVEQTRAAAASIRRELEQQQIGGVRVRASFGCRAYPDSGTVTG